MVSLRFLVACTVTLAPVALAGPITGLPDTPADALRTVEGSNVKIPDIRKRLDNISSPNEDPNLAEPNNKEGESQVPNLDSLMSSILVQVNDLVNNSTEGTPNVNRIGPLLDSVQPYHLSCVISILY
ncbi:hypothetical protein B0I37DRAFT_381696 [Chaetomium sp. MPI-CAGE-AT-0009]|nr:hypothetical protein B0I37DRAFT_381696 [Chaetomium sp. MPI-CAGE-AT-0009]